MRRYAAIVVFALATLLAFDQERASAIEEIQVVEVQGVLHLDQIFVASHFTVAYTDVNFDVLNRFDDNHFTNTIGVTSATKNSEGLTAYRRYERIVANLGSSHLLGNRYAAQRSSGGYNVLKMPSAEQSAASFERTRFRVGNST